MLDKISNITQTQNCKVFYFPSPYGRLGITTKKRKLAAWVQAVLTVVRMWGIRVIAKII